MVELSHLTAGALQILVEPSAEGFDAKLAAKLTSAERVAQQTATRVGASVDSISVSSARLAEKTTVAQLRSVAATERYNQLLKSQKATVAQLASAQAAQLTAAQRLASVQREGAATAEAQARRLTAQRGLTGRAGLAGGIAGSAGGIAGLALGAGVAGATVQGVRTFEEMTNQVRQLQRVTGATAEDSSKFLHILDRYGLSGDTATQSLARLAKNITLTPEKLKQFGVEIVKNKDGTTDLTKTLLSANDAFHKIADPARRDTLALELFGKGGQKLIPILAANRDTLKGFVDEAKRSGLIFSQADLNRARDLAIAQKSLTEAWQGAEIALARGVVPALTDMETKATSVIQFFENHPGVARFTKDLAGLTVGLFAVNKAIKVLDAVRTSVLFTKILNVTATNAATAANARLAESYAAVATAAATATPAVVALDAAEVGGAAAGGAAALGDVAIGGTGLARIGALGRTGALVRGATLAAGVVDPVILASLFAGTDNGPKGLDKLDEQQANLLKNVTYSNGGYSIAGVAVTDPKLQALLSINSVKGAPGPGEDSYDIERSLSKKYPGLFTNPYTGHPGADVTAAQAQNRLLAAAILGAQTDVATQKAKQAATVAAQAQAGASYFASIDPNSVPSTQVDRSPLTASVSSARKSQVDAVARVRIAEEALTALRTGKTAPSALQLARAEDTLRRAKEASATAADKVRGAEKKLGDTRATTALAPSEVLAKLRGQVGFQDKQAKAYNQLIGEGFKAPALELLGKLDAQAPGTLAEIAAHMTPKLRRQIKASVRQLGLDSSIIADAMDPALHDAAVQNARTYATTLHGRINRALRGLFIDAGTVTPLLPGSRGGRDPDIPVNPPAVPRHGSEVNIGTLVIHGQDAREIEKRIRAKARRGRAVL